MALQDPREGFSRFDAKIDGVVCWQLALGKLQSDAWYSTFSKSWKVPSSVRSFKKTVFRRVVHLLEKGACQ